MKKMYLLVFLLSACASASPKHHSQEDLAVELVRWWKLRTENNLEAKTYVYEVCKKNLRCERELDECMYTLGQYELNRRLERAKECIKEAGKK